MTRVVLAPRYAETDLCADSGAQSGGLMSDRFEQHRRTVGEDKVIDNLSFIIEHINPIHH